MPEEKQDRKALASANVRDEARTLAREHPRFTTVSAILLLFLFLAAAGSAGLAVWEWHKEKQARQAEQQAIEKSKKAEKEAEKSKGKLKRAVDEEKERTRERDQAQEAEQAARRSEEQMKAILSFLKSKLLSAGRPADVSLTEAFWAGSQGKDLTVRKGITLRQAVDETESQVAEAFADRPRAEASVREMLGLAYLNLGAAKEAVRQYERAFELRKAVQGNNAPETAACRQQLAVTYRLAGRAADADHLFHRQPYSPAYSSALAVRGALLLEQKKPAEAELALRECLIIRQKLQPDDWTTFDTKSMLGEALLEQKKYADAEPLLRSGYEGLKQHETQIPSQDKGRFTKALERLVRLYEDWDKKDKAIRCRKELEKVEATEKSRRSPD